MKVFYKILKVVIPLVLVALSIYFFAGADGSERKHLLTYLDHNSVAYHKQSANDVQNVFEAFDSRTKHTNLGVDLTDSSALMQYFAMNDGVISWHTTRQKTLAKVYWVFVHDQYDPFEDSALVVEQINNIYEVQLNDEKYFLAVSSTMVALSTNSEIIQELAPFNFYDDGLSTLLNKGIVKGDWEKLKLYLQEVSPVFDNIMINAKGYNLEFYKGSNAVFYTLNLNDIQDPCIGETKAHFNGSLPNSTLAVWQSSFDDNNCILNKYLRGNEQKLWDLEERYQVKVSTIMDAWFDGSFRSVYCGFNGISAQFKVATLKQDAAPFASGSKFFVDYQNIKVGNAYPQMNFTIARVIPEGLSFVLFPETVNAYSSLFVTQYKNHLYFAKKREPLVLLLNELVTGNTVSRFDQIVEAQHHFFFKFPSMLKYNHENSIVSNDQRSFLVQGKSIMQNSDLIVQGQIVFE